MGISSVLVKISWLLMFCSRLNGTTGVCGDDEEGSSSFDGAEETELELSRSCKKITFRSPHDGIILLEFHHTEESRVEEDPILSLAKARGAIDIDTLLRQYSSFSVFCKKQYLDCLRKPEERIYLRCIVPFYESILPQIEKSIDELTNNTLLFSVSALSSPEWAIKYQKCKKYFDDFLCERDKALHRIRDYFERGGLYSKNRYIDAIESSFKEVDGLFSRVKDIEKMQEELKRLIMSSKPHTLTLQDALMHIHESIANLELIKRQYHLEFSRLPSRPILNAIAKGRLDGLDKLHGDLVASLERLLPNSYGFESQVLKEFESNRKRAAGILSVIFLLERSVIDFTVAFKKSFKNLFKVSGLSDEEKEVLAELAVGYTELYDEFLIVYKDMSATVYAPNPQNLCGTE